MFPRSRISVIPGSTRDLRDDGWEHRRADFGTTDGDKRFAFPGRRLSGYTLAPSSRACPGTYSKRPRSKNNHRWMFPRIPNIAGAISGRRMEVSFRDAETTHSPSSRACPGTYSNRPRSKNNHRWMFPRSRISLGRFRDDGWRYAIAMLRRPTPRHPVYGLLVYCNTDLVI